MTAFAVLSVLVLSSVSWIGTDAVYKLQHDSEPLSYRLHLEPNIMENYFNGSLVIEFRMTITTTVLLINQKDLKLQTVEIVGIPIIAWGIDNEKEVLFMYCQYGLLRDHIYTMKIKYQGELKESKVGFFKNKYLVGNDTRWMAATYFQPTYARLAFPCWDEPLYRSTFNISITHLSSYNTVLSNMPILNQTKHDDNTITTYFRNSMLMPTYLVAFIVSDYGYKHHKNDSIRIYTKSDSIHQTEMAHSYSLQAMRVMDEYTRIPYFQYNPKMDLVTINGMKTGGMENWGIITFREEKLLYENGISTTIDKDNLIMLISHEFAHQWFGNLISPEWWDYVWVSEGFATYFQYFIMHKVKPSWRSMDFFVVKTMQRDAFNMDVGNSRPVNKKTEPQSNLEEVFIMAYDKAACIIRMLSHIVTEEVFHTGIRFYLKDSVLLSLGSPHYLLKQLQNAAGRDKKWAGAELEEIAQNWIMQAGYPLVTVRKTKSGFWLSQKRFSPENAMQKWWIPITYATNKNLNFTNTSVTDWMSPHTDSPLVLETKADWIILNKQQTGYYRVNYDDEIWQKLTEYLRSSNMHKIHPVNRAQLIDDALTLARGNHTTYENALSLTLYLHREIDPIPWLSIFEQLEFLHHVIFPSKHYDIFKHYIRYIMHSVTTNVTYVASSNDNHPTKLLKHYAMKWACLADIKECVDEAHKEFKAWMENPKYHIDPDLKFVILCTGLRTASEDVWTKAMEILFHEAAQSISKINPMEVLGCSNNPRILEKFLIMAAQPYGNIDFIEAAISVLTNTNVSGVHIVLDLLEFNRTQIVQMDDFDNQIHVIALYVAQTLTTSEDYLRLSSFLATLKFGDEGTYDILKNAILSINWIEDYGSGIDDWLLNHEKLFKSSGTKKTFMSLLLICSIFNTMLFRIFL